MIPMHPYPMYYPPNTPVTPNTPTHPAYGNPYYYLAGPMPPGPNGILPPPGASLPLPGASLPSPPAQRPPAEPLRTVKAKRLKAHTVTTKSFSIPMVPRDKKGKPMLPLNVGIMTVINLGEVCMREHFHTERYIFPVGYEVTRYMRSFNQLSRVLIVNISCLVTDDIYPQLILELKLFITVRSLMAVMDQNSKLYRLTGPTSLSSLALQQEHGLIL